MCRSYYKCWLVVFLLLAVPAAGTSAQNRRATQRAEFWGFTGPWEDASTASVRAHGGQLSAVINGWITIDSSSALPVIPSPYLDTVRPRGGTPQRMAIVTTWHGEDFHREPIRLLGRDPRRLARAAGSIARYAQQMRYSGLVLDFESLQAADLPALLKVSKAIADSAHAHRVRTIAMAVPATDTEAYPARPLLGVVDALVVMLYDQHWAGSDPGPIAEPSWVRSSLAKRVAEVGPSRLIAGLPTYGYRWRKGKPAESIGFADAVRMANASRAPLQRDAGSQFLRSRARDGSEIWVSDATLLGRLVRECQSLGVTRFAIWRLGEEDPAIWRSVVR
jgi:peptidoglycan-N-acetylglucosamine deacetylase